MVFPLPDRTAMLLLEIDDTSHSPDMMSQFSGLRNEEVAGQQVGDVVLSDDVGC